MDSPAKSGIGAAVRRVEDERFLAGRGTFVDDLLPPGTLHAHVLRSPHAHARIERIGEAPGALLVLTAQDLAREGIGGLPCEAFPAAPGAYAFRPLQPILAVGKVRHVGEAVALVVAESAARAADAAEALEVEYAALPAVTLEDALAAGAPKVWDEAQANVSFEVERGDRDAVERAFASSFFRTRIQIKHPRASANSIEPRAALAIPQGSGCTLYSTAQTPFAVRDTVAAVLGMAKEDLRVVVPDVGGAFGMKSRIYPEEALVVWAARKLGRPVKWTSQRGEGLAADMHGRHQVADAELALDREGRALAMRVSVAIDLGAYLSHHAGVAPLNAAISYTNTYDIPLIHARVRACFTNTVPVGPYRGTAKPEATYVTERLFEKAAREMGVDGVALRRKNFIRTFPYKTPGGYVFDSGEFERVLDKALALADWHGFPERKSKSQRLRGIGLAMHCQRAGSLPESMALRVAADGSVAVLAGTLSTGQGHETMFAQMAAEWLGAPLGKVSVLQGDTAKLASGLGTFAQRSMNAGGSALRIAAQEVIRKGSEVAAGLLEAAVADIEFVAGEFRVKGTDRLVTLAQAARDGLEGDGTHPGPNNFPNGCMVAEVEVDPETGAVEVLSLTAVDDVGVVINPLTLEGQLHGSIAQGLGPSLFEQVVYERESGQLLTGSFMDYAMPRALDMPPVRAGLHLVPTKTNLLGVKGGSEAGNVGVPPAIVHAIIDALGVSDVPLPATPERVWNLIRAGRKA